MPKLGALAIAKAHPFVFGAVLAVAIGIVVYQLVKPKKQKKLKYSSNGPGGGDDDSPSNGPYYYDPETKSITNSAPPNSDIRKRHVARKSVSSSNENQSDAPQQDKKISKEIKTESLSKEVQTESIDNNQNMNDSKVLPDKDLDSAMSVNEKVNVYFFRNISETDSVDSNEESDSTNEDFKPIKECCCDYKSQSTENSNASDSISSDWSDVSLTEIKNMKKKKRPSRASSICSVTSIESESSIGTVLSGDSELCRGCEQNPVNTHAQPCNHRYMCSDCAMRIFRLFKKCKVCRAKIERIVVEE